MRPRPEKGMNNITRRGDRYCSNEQVHQRNRGMVSRFQKRHEQPKPLCGCVCGCVCGCTGARSSVRGCGCGCGFGCGCGVEQVAAEEGLVCFSIRFSFFKKNCFPFLLYSSKELSGWWRGLAYRDPSSPCLIDAIDLEVLGGAECLPVSPRDRILSKASPDDFVRRAFHVYEWNHSNHFFF